jgi:hypothetical protein
MIGISIASPRKLSGKSGADRPAVFDRFAQLSVTNIVTSVPSAQRKNKFPLEDFFENPEK